MPKLTDPEIAERLKTVPQWTRDGDRIHREFTCPTFADAVAFADGEASARNSRQPGSDRGLDLRFRRSFAEWQKDLIPLRCRRRTMPAATFQE